MADQWHAQPARAEQTMALVRGVEPRGTAGAGPLNAWVRRDGNQQKKCIDHMVWVTTDLQRHAPGRVRHYAERPESEQAEEQRKSGGWQRTKLSATRSRASGFSVLTVV
jgi:hypothetical protein